METIVLERVERPAAALAPQIALYDPELRYLLELTYRQSRNRDGDGEPTSAGLSINVAELGKDALVDIESVRRITVPAHLYQRRDGRRERVPAVWEFGGHKERRNEISDCVIVGNQFGHPVKARDVCKVQYARVPNPSGRHALCPVQPGAILGLGWERRGEVVLLVYRVGEHGALPATPGYTPKPSDPYVALNADLIGLYRTNWAGNSGQWKSPTAVKQQVNFDWLFSQLGAKVKAEQIRACNIELLWSVPVKPERAAAHELPVELEVTTVVVPPEHFVPEIYIRGAKYRQALVAANHKQRNQPMPAALYYSVEAQPDPADPSAPAKLPSLTLRYCVPSLLDDHPPISIETVLDGAIPALLATEPALVYDCEDYAGLYDAVANGGETRYLLANH